MRISLTGGATFIEAASPGSVLNGADTNRISGASIRRATAAALLAAWSLVVAGCDKELLGLPRVPLSVVSPDGGAVALVRNHPNIDPPAQSIWLEIGSDRKLLRRLGPDSDWCNTIVWSSDGSTVAFLVQDARILVADRHSRRIVSEKWLTEWKGEYPPYRIVEGLTLSADGREAIFRDCERRLRRSPDCSERRVAIP